ncbi:CoA transferase [Tepidiforma sp.]|uniref:CaiB/BaiF CoA transferase family protein n=1 Tax=Tepidiforma sp. TaxID=2682230 RepID=UPI0021DBCCFC|nr:CoA transferase [Tepidiforma sp.]MCX7616638.1 CoA transferase [Tepidiforma sp.]GIW19634.1 MAG: succinyl-CoA--D-citramalate CoA-transferase [Tepidiforma sp.]
MPPALAALAGIRVISAGQILAAPFCATLFAEFGAEVIKVEPPGTGEANRGNLSFEQDNRGQKSVTLDLARGEGRALFRRLTAAADVLIENFRPGTLEAWGLAPDDLREENPGLVVVRISGYGQDGPYRDRAGFDRVALAFSGITAVTGYPDRPPVRPGYFIGDYGAGIFAAFGALAALRARDLTGRGQDVDVALYEAVWRMSGTHAANFGLTGRDRPRSGNYYPGVVPAEQFETADGHYLVINATTQRSFERLCAAIGQPELVADPRFTPRQNLLANHEAIHAILRDWAAGLTLAEAQAALDRHGVPASKVYQVSDIVADDHYAAREQVVTVDSPVFGPILQPGVVPRLTATPGAVPGRAPLLGEHNREVYQGLLGLTDAEIERLAAAGII